MALPVEEYGICPLCYIPATHLCDTCRVVTYCNEDCLKKDLNNHTVYCGLLQEATQEELYEYTGKPIVEDSCTMRIYSHLLHTKKNGGLFIEYSGNKYAMVYYTYAEDSAIQDEMYFSVITSSTMGVLRGYTLKRVLAPLLALIVDNTFYESKSILCGKLGSYTLTTYKP